MLNGDEVAKAHRIAIAFKNVSSTPDGRIVFGYMAEALGWDKRSHCPGDPCTTAFNDGAKESIRLFLRMSSLSHESIVAMSYEAAEALNYTENG